jgi:hypothetical protein
MKSLSGNPLAALFLILVIAGTVLIVSSFVSFPWGVSGGKIVRAGGFSLLFFGIGEYLNHPPLARHRVAPQQTGNIQLSPKKKRITCGLGNLFDVLAIISVFIAASYLFFPDNG